MLAHWRMCCFRSFFFLLAFLFIFCLFVQWISVKLYATGQEQQLNAPSLSNRLYSSNQIHVSNIQDSAVWHSGLLLSYITLANSVAPRCHRSQTNKVQQIEAEYSYFLVVTANETVTEPSLLWKLLCNVGSVEQFKPPSMIIKSLLTAEIAVLYCKNLYYYYRIFVI